MTVAIEHPQQTADRTLTIQGDWDKFRLIQSAFDETQGIRLFYFDGEIEILMPSKLHEIFSHVLGVLLTNFLAYQGILFLGMGTADQEKEGISSAQPDQSYCIGKQKKIPDLSIEVVFTSGGAKKLQRYRAIGVPEVWFWEDGVLRLYRLRENGYEKIQQSELEGLRNLDLDVLKRHMLMAETDLGAAVRSFNAYIFEAQVGR
jgi:Uma2 family endonuclease